MIGTTPQYWTAQDVGLWLTLPTGRVIRLARRGAIPCIVLPDGELLFDPAELTAWLDAHRKGALHAD
jgi:hypothetical protein